LIGHDDDATMVNSLLEMLAMKQGEVAYIERIDTSPLLNRKGELILIRGAATTRLDRRQDVDVASPKFVNHRILSSILVHIETQFTHDASFPGVSWRLNSSYRTSAAANSDSTSA
jgi:hypothetical protein